VEVGREFWGRYPEQFRQGFKDTAVLGPYHARLLDQSYFPVLGSIPKGGKMRNRRHLDMSVAQFEDDAVKVVDRSGWGLPVPNKEAAYISLAKYAKSVKPVTAVQAFAMNTASEWLERQFGPHMCGSRIKSLEEAKASLDKTTSPGFPWTHLYSTKNDMIDHMAGLFDIFMEEDWERLKFNDYVAVFGNSLKEEIRLQEKIEANSLRTFTAGPVEMTVHGIRLFEDMNQKFYDSHLKTPSVVGFSVLKGGWNDLYRKLSKFSNGFALDESQYDSSLRNYLMWTIASFRWNMLRESDRTPDNLARLQVYYRNLVNTVIITTEGVFVIKQGGNPSGSVNTISDNTLILYVLLAYAWIMVSPDNMRNYDSFDSQLALALCGDDNTWSVSDEACVFYNARSVIAEWSVLGVTTTTDCLDPRPVEKLDFLSAFTVFIDGIAVPLYKREKLLTSLLYSQDADNPSFTLLRSAALLRVGYADPQIRGYLRELISWLVGHYGEVLAEDPEWKASLRQVPTDIQLRRLFLGPDIVPMFAQSFVGARKDKIPIKSCVEMEARPQRPKRVRTRKPRVEVILDTNRRIPRKERITVLEKTPVKNLPRIKPKQAHQAMRNDYLQTLVDPENYPGVKYPDNFRRKTSTYQGLCDFDNYIFTGTEGFIPVGAPTDSILPLEPAGSFAVVQRPSVIHPVMQYVAETPAFDGEGGLSKLTMTCASQTEDYGLFPLMRNASSPASSQQTMVMTPGTTVNLKAEGAWSDQDFSSPPFVGEMPDGQGEFYGHTFAWTQEAAGSGITAANAFINLVTDLTTDPSDGGAVAGLQVRLVTEGIVGDWVTPLPAYAGDYRTMVALIPLQEFAQNSVAGGTPLIFSAAVSRPGIGLQMQFVTLESGSAAYTLPCAIIRATCQFSLGTGGVSPGSHVVARWRPVDFEDQEFLEQNVDQYRCVSAAMWQKCTASDLTNGGDIAALSYKGGQSPMELDLTEYGSLSQVPEAYAGPFKLGSYSIWLPSNDNDMNFRQINPFNIYDFPWIASAGIYQVPPTVVTTGSLRCRITANYEYTTKSRVPTGTTSPVAPWKIAHAATLLRDFRTSMENPLHWAAIKDVLNKAVGWGKDAFSWFNDNKSWLAPAAGAAMSLLL